MMFSSPSFFMSTGPGVSFYDEVIADSPIAYWTMDGAGTAEEISSNNLTLNNGVLTGQTPILTSGDSLVFDGTDDYAVSSSLGLSALPVTIEKLININTLTNFYPIFATNGNVSNYYGILVAMHTSGYFFITLGDGTGTGPGNRKSFQTASSLYTSGTDYHVVARVNSFSSVDVFINGTKYAASFASGTASTISFSSGVGAFAYSLVGATQYSAIKFDDTAVYASALSDSRIAAHYEATGI